jgi:hypothetical protein
MEDDRHGLKSSHPEWRYGCEARGAQFVDALVVA